jgi:hypothetical protein
MARSGASEKLPSAGSAQNVAEETPMSYAQAKEIALLRLELRASWNTGDRVAACAALARFAQVAGNDNEIIAEVRRWRIKLGAA